MDSTTVRSGQSETKTSRKIRRHLPVTYRKPHVDRSIDFGLEDQADWNPRTHRVAEGLAESDCFRRTMPTDLLTEASLLTAGALEASYRPNDKAPAGAYPLLFQTGETSKGQL